jgi:hypothetical protein
LEKVKLVIIMRIIFLIVILLISDICFSQNDLIRTSEFVGQLKRRDLIYTKNMELIEEVYYSLRQKQINSIEYKNEKIVKFYGYNEKGDIIFYINFELGTYDYPKEKLFLKFKNNFIFNGVQRDGNLVITYKDGIREGKLLQTDYGYKSNQLSIYKNIDYNQRINIFNLINFYYEINDNDFTLSNGIFLNFKNEKLNGIQLGFYEYGYPRFKSVFNNNYIKFYNSFSNYGSIITKIDTDSSLIINKPIILNGLLNNEQKGKSISFNVLSETGKFYSDFYLNNESCINCNEQDEFYILKYNTNLCSFLVKKYINKNDLNYFDISNYITIKNLLNESNNINYGLKKEFDDNKVMINDDNPNLLRLILNIKKYRLSKFDIKKNNFEELNFY